MSESSVKKSRMTAATGLFLQTLDEQNVEKQIVNFIVPEEQHVLLANILKNNMRIVKHDSFVIGWFYFDEWTRIFDFDKFPFALVNVEFLPPPHEYTFVGMHDAELLMQIVEKAFFWQTWTGAEYHLHATNQKPVNVRFNFKTTLDENTFYPTDLQALIETHGEKDWFNNSVFATNLNFFPKRVLIEAARTLFLSNIPDYDLQILRLQKAGLVFNTADFKTYGGMEFQASYMILDGKFRFPLYKMNSLRYVHRFALEAVESLINISMDHVDEFQTFVRKNYKQLKPLYEWKSSDYQTLNRLAFANEGTVKMMQLDKWIRQPLFQSKNTFNVFRAFWLGAESEDGVQRGPDFQSLVPGQILDNNGFLATAFFLPPEQFIGKACCLMVIEIPVGASYFILDGKDSGYFMDEFDSKSAPEEGGTEHEILFPLRTRLRFKRVQIMQAYNRTVDVAFFDYVMDNDTNLLRQVCMENTTIVAQETATSRHKDLIFAHAIINKPTLAKEMVQLKIADFNVMNGFVFDVLAYSKTSHRRLSQIGLTGHDLMNIKIRDVLDFFLKGAEKDNPFVITVLEKLNIELPLDYEDYDDDDIVRDNIFTIISIYKAQSFLQKMLQNPSVNKNFNLVVQKSRAYDLDFFKSNSKLFTDAKSKWKLLSEFYSRHQIFEMEAKIERWIAQNKVYKLQAINPGYFKTGVDFLHFAVLYNATDCILFLAKQTTKFSNKFIEAAVKFLPINIIVKLETETHLFSEHMMYSFGGEKINIAMYAAIQNGILEVVRFLPKEENSKHKYLEFTLKSENFKLEVLSVFLQIPGYLYNWKYLKNLAQENLQGETLRQTLALMKSYK